MRIAVVAVSLVLRPVVVVVATFLVNSMLVSVCVCVCVWMLEPLPVEAETSKQKYFMQFLEGDFSMSLLVVFSHFVFLLLCGFVFWDLNLNLGRIGAQFDRANS